MLSKHLQKAVEQNKNESASIAPIAQFDAEIIDTIVEICRKIYYPEIATILNKWKQEGDEIILHKLKFFLQEGSAASKIIVGLGDKELNIQFFQSISLINSYDNNKHVPIYKIIINEDSTDKMLFCNLEVVYYSEEKRQIALDDFKERTKFLHIKYL
jgi:hypothetical protein